VSPDHRCFALDRTPPQGATRKVQVLSGCASSPGPGPLRLKQGSGFAASLRAQAHGAAREVVGGGTGAIDAAVDVCLAEIEALEARLIAQTEVVKLVRSYGEDDWLRSLAGAVLEGREADYARCLPRTLFDPDIAEALPQEPRGPIR
jgi:hypothetical protein